jgi:hypothetical protein
VLLGAALGLAACSATSRDAAARVSDLERQRDLLRARIAEKIGSDVRFQGMPGDGLRIGVPTALARVLLERIVTGLGERVTLRLSGLKAHKSGTVKKVVTLGAYELDIAINEVTGQLAAGRPDVRFGNNSVSVTLPVKVASGHGTATIALDWDGKSVGEVICGNLKLKEDVAGEVKPDEYQLRGTLAFATTRNSLLALPRFPLTEIKLQIEPSPESWDKVKSILESQQGICGFVVDKIDVPETLRHLLDKGIDVKLPTDKIKPIAVPVGLAPTIAIGDREVTVDATLGHLAISPHTIWVGADVTLAEKLARR